jgi:pyruvate/2-oxoacid:ferredoxin oxidoreductase alpha subunit
MGLNGDEAIAYALKQCNVDLVAAYPITPQTIIVEKFSEYVAEGEVECNVCEYWRCFGWRPSLYCICFCWLSAHA